MRALNRYSMVLGLVALVAAACGSGPQTSESTDAAAEVPTAAATTGTEVETTAGPTTVQSTAPDDVGGATEATYASTTFEVPFDLTVPTWLSAAPREEQPNFVTWQAPDTDRAVRFLIPVNMYPPDGTGTTPPPEDYVSYLLSQADYGAHFAELSETTVDGRPATVVTATVDDSLDGSLGCPEKDMAAGDCFGLQPDFILRIAVIDTGDRTLLVWLRNDAAAAVDMTTEIESFEQFLMGVRFSERAVEPPPATVVPEATPLDGTYSWTITRDDALAHGTPGDKQPEVLATYPSTFTMTMGDGMWHLRHRGVDGDWDDGGGSYTVEGDQVAFDWHGTLLTFTFTVDDNGTLYLEPQLPMDTGDHFIWATNPWERIDAVTPLDGTYGWTITADDALAHGLPSDKEPENLATFPWVFTITMNAGTWDLRHRDGEGDSNDGGGSYTIDGDQIAFDWQTEGYTQTYTYSVDDNGTLRLDPQPPINPGDQFGWATNPWEKIN